jgi:ADP-dependent phosphofructokinase/glucokinase
VSTVSTVSTVNSEVVLGLGGTVDYEIVWDSSALERLAAVHGITAAELDTDRPIATERDLVVSVLRFFRTGSGGERFVASSGIVEAFAERFVTRVTLGGTGVRAAIAMQTLGVPSLLHLVSIDNWVRRLLPDGCRYLCSADHDSTDPHLIVQFAAGAEVRLGDDVLRAPHPNRLIYSNDPPNRELALSDELGEALSHARLFLISGFNSMQDPGLLDRRLADLKRHMARLPPEALVIYEDAGFHRPELNARVRSALVDAVDVFSMNEDELQGHLGRRLDLLDAREMATALREVQRLIPARTVVVHTRHWSIALGEYAPGYRGALDGGIIMASTRYEYGDGFTSAEYHEMAARPRSTEGTAFCSALTQQMPVPLCVRPAFLLDVANPTTVGLGDTFVGGFIAAMAASSAAVEMTP